MSVRSCCLLPSFVLALGAIAPTARGQEAAPVIEFAVEFCLDCHDTAGRKGDFELESVLDRPPGEQAEIWERAIRRLDARQMPPPDKKRPEEETYLAALANLKGALDAASAAQPRPGRTETIRRLTRTEYRNAIRDLLDLEVEIAELLPMDESSHGFDNVTVSSLSPTLLSRYVSAAQKISRLAVSRAPDSAQLRVVRLPGDRTQEKHVAGLPFGTRGGTLIAHNVPAAGEYDLEVRLSRDRNEEVEGLREPHELLILVDRAEVARFTVKPPRDNNHSSVDQHLSTRVQLPAGPVAIGVTFIDQGNSLLETKRQPYEAHFNMHRHPRRTPAVFQVSISGPYAVHPPNETPSRHRILSRRPADLDDLAAAREILAPLVRRAYRRPVTDDDLARPLEFFRAAHHTDGFEAGLEAALAALLVSPRFLLRIENNPPGLPPGTAYPLDDHALASRLSFFLWSSLPDDELLDLAARGDLRDPDVLAQQARRMLADPKARALVTNFAGQWLHLRNLDSVTRDLRLFPDFDDNLREAFRRETELFVESVLLEDRSILELLDADYTFLNERLAKHYAIPHIYGSRFRRVALDDSSRRGGLLRHGSVLTVTSYANRTSPVIRGNWILENILGTPTPPPPPEVPALEESVVAADLPIRERLAAHREDRSCAVCHNRIDPAGFPLEHFDAVGRWRERDHEQTIDARGGLADGRELAGVAELESALRDRPDLFARTLAEKLLTYALGRGVSHEDAPAIRKIVAEARAAEYRFSSLVAGLVKSVPFTMRTTQ